MNKLPASIYELSGRVIKGDGYGRKLGFPTANLDRRGYVRKGRKIKLGIWAGEAGCQLSVNSYQSYKSAIVIGPLDKKGLPKIEAHLLNFKGNLYGKKITLALHKYIRPFKKFKSEEKLKRQIAKDVRILKILDM